MNAGELDKQITFLRKTIAYDTVNQPIETWVDANTVWAGVITTGGREFYAAQKLNAETSAVFKIRFTRAVNEKMRIRYGNQTLEVVAINDVDGKHEELQISAKAVK